MVENILNMRIGESGYAFLIDNKGEFLAHPNLNPENPGAFADEAADFADVLADMNDEESGLTQGNIGNTEYYIAYAPLATTGWSLGIAVEYDETISGALSMKENIDAQAAEVKEQIRDTLSSVMFRFIALTCVIIVIVLVISILVSGSVTKPMLKLTKGVIEVGKGDLDKKVDISGGDEIGTLAACFNKMTDDLKQHIADLSKVTAEKERIGAELNVATQIQASMLPHIFPPFPHRTDFDLYATMQPAKEVGGDFYDFFMTDDDNMFVVIADVSGKGVPAALFMVIAKTLLKNNAQLGLLPAEILSKTNEQLNDGNDTEMFVTVFIGRLQLSTGKFTFANAGHNPPAIKHRGGQWEYLKAQRGLVLAIMEGIKYKDNEITLGKGDMLFLYTDGVTEAMNRENALYGDPRLIETLNGISDTASLAELEAAEKADIFAFAGGAEQADDITMLVMRYIGH
jgi:sigma-B regulation protein RsbU (phosphoserine phosphatase)